MKRKLFLQEIIGTKLKLFQLICIITFIFTAMSLSVTFIQSQHQNHNRPDIELSGKSISEEVPFLRYDSLEYFYQFLHQHEKHDDFTLYPVIYRVAKTISTDTYEDIEINLEGYTVEYLNQYVKGNIIEGRLPENEQEIVVSAYLLRYIDISVGDEIDSISIGQEIEDDTTSFRLYFNESEQDISRYRVVGIVDDMNNLFSIIRIMPEHVMPNRLFIYFSPSISEVEMENIFMEAASIGLRDFIGSQNDNYLENSDSEFTSIMIVVIIALFFVITLVVLVMYLMKGAYRKIGILKALGVKDKIVLQVFANGFLYLLLSCLVVSILLVNVAYVMVNTFINNYYGFAVNLMRYSLQSLLIQVIFTFMGYVIIVVMIRRISYKITPKDCIALN